MYMLRNIPCFQGKVSRMRIEDQLQRKLGVLEMREVMFMNEGWWFVTQVFAASLLQFLGPPLPMTLKQTNTFGQ